MKQALAWLLVSLLFVGDRASACATIGSLVKTEHCQIRIENAQQAEQTLRSAMAKCGISESELPAMLELLKSGYSFVERYTKSRFREIHKPGKCGSNQIGIVQQWMGYGFRYYPDTQCPIPACP